MSHTTKMLCSLRLPRTPCSTIHKILCNIQNASFTTRSTLSYSAASSGSSSWPSVAPVTKRAFTTAKPLSFPQEEETASTTLPSNPQTHYDYFQKTLPRGPPPKGKFDIDLKALRREFLQLQSQAHPDLHQGVYKQRAEALSSRINDAYKTLQDPLKRAQYILSLNGYETEGDEAAKMGDEIGDQELLMTVLEAREAIEDAQDLSDLDTVKTENEERVVETVSQLENTLDAGLWEEAKEHVVKLRYWMNIKQSIGEWEPGKPVVLQH